MLRKDTNWMMSIVDFVLSSALIYFGSIFFADAYVTFWGSLLAGALLAVIEIFQHTWLLSSKHLKREKSVG